MSEIKLRIVPHSEEPCEECGRAGDINARYNAPHYCDNPTCPGNITRQKLEMFEKMKCCGNCYYMDILDNYGGVCTFDENADIPIDRMGKCDDWKFGGE